MILAGFIAFSAVSYIVLVNHFDPNVTGIANIDQHKLAESEFLSIVYVSRFGCWNICDGSSRWTFVVVRLVVLGHPCSLCSASSVYVGLLDVFASLLPAHQL